jgi:hypothetical protein
MLFRSTPWTRQFIADAWHSKHLATPISWREQAAMLHMLGVRGNRRHLCIVKQRALNAFPNMTACHDGAGTFQVCGGAWVVAGGWQGDVLSRQHVRFVRLRAHCTRARHEGVCCDSAETCCPWRHQGVHRHACVCLRQIIGVVYCVDHTCIGLWRGGLQHEQQKATSRAAAAYDMRWVRFENGKRM